MGKIKIKVRKLMGNAHLPERGTEYSAGWDLTALWRKIDEYGNIVYGTGLAMEIPKGYVGLLFPRSSVAKYSQMLTNCVGVIDSDYRGEILAKFKFVSEGKEYLPGERICQLIVMPFPEVEFEESSRLSETERGLGGYGSTGK